MLVIDNVNRFDSGKYSLTLTNSSGTKTAVIVVRILDSPSAPQHFTVKEIKKDSVILTWDTPLNDGGAKITNYIVEKRESVRKAYTTVTINCTANTLKIEELPEGGIFYFRVSAVNAYGQGQMVESKEIKVSEVPLPPNKIIVVDVTKTSVSLGWEKPAHDGGSKVLCYNVEFKPKSGDKWGTACTVKVLEATIPNLTPNEAYLFRVIAINEKGKSEPRDLGLPVVAKDIGIEPSINLHFNTFSVKAGEDLTVEVPVRGRPKPAVSWKKDNLPLKQTSSVTILNTATSSKVIIKEARKEHVGKYEITLANTAGTATADIGIIVLDKPGPPKGIKVDAVTSDSITLSWSPPEYDGGCSISNYIVEKRDNNSQEWQIAASNVARTSFKAGRLTHGAEYQFRIYAVNRYGKSTYLDSPGITAQYNFKQPGPPSTPIVKLATKSYMLIVLTDTSTSLIIKDSVRGDSGQYALTLRNIAGKVTVPINCVILDKPGPSAGPLQVTDLTAEDCTLSWGPPQETGGADITHYIVEKRETSRLAWTLVKGDITKTYLKVKGLLKGNEYIFKVLAVNKHGIGEALESESIKVTDPYTLATAPSSVDVISITGDSMTVTWCKPATDGGSPIRGYVVERREKTGMRWIRVNRELVAECSLLVPKLRKGCEYDFRVSAENAAGLSPPNPLVVPSRPTKPKIVNSTKDSVSIVWKPPISDGGAPILGYSVEFRDYLRRPEFFVFFFTLYCLVLIFQQRFLLEESPCQKSLCPKITSSSRHLRGF
uniref:Titin n=1 Tax=Oryzias latipes TaxID=8090 RepID=A0A3P9IP48_ORYLA